MLAVLDPILSLLVLLGVGDLVAVFVAPDALSSIVYLKSGVSVEESLLVSILLQKILERLLIVFLPPLERQLLLIFCDALTGINIRHRVHVHFGSVDAAGANWHQKRHTQQKNLAWFW